MVRVGIVIPPGPPVGACGRCRDHCRALRRAGRPTWRGLVRL